ncbi:MAG TPA: choice-of-anchor Q domain-containing protein [Blastocatellia bacterium]|nr:choice-of-anchor Q domain-containing protein [Blastocatellia bacterium]
MKATVRFRAYLLTSLIALFAVALTGRHVAVKAQTCTTNPVVTTNADSGMGSLRDAISNACDGSTITFANSVTSPIVLQSELDVDKNLTIQGPGAGTLTISGNKAVRVFHLGSVTPGVTISISDLTIADGLATGNLAGGGGIRNEATPNTVTVTGCVFTGNTTSGETLAEGGAIINIGNLMNVANCTFTGNTAEAAEAQAGVSAHGGAIATEVAMNLTACTISGNSAQDVGQGGGIYNIGGLTMANCTIVGNTSAVQGGGVFNQNTMTLINDTIAGNTAQVAGGLFQAGSFCAIQNTIVALNSGTSSNPDVATRDFSFTSLGFNLIGKGDGGAGLTNGVTNDQVGSVASPLDPGLQEDMMGNPLLQNNGGPTETVALVQGSPAIDTGSDSVLMAPDSLATDQRGPGFPRKLCIHVDIGAYEFKFNGPPTINCPANITVGIIPGQLSGSASFSASASDFCDGPVPTSFKIGATTITSPHTFPVGVTTVTVSATSLATGLTGTCSFTVTVAADAVCMKDDHTGDLFQFNTQTGAYTYTRCKDGFTVTGTGKVTVASGTINLTDSESTKRISAAFSPGQLTGRANITLIPARGVFQTLTVSQTNPHATCSCE